MAKEFMTGKARISYPSLFKAVLSDQAKTQGKEPAYSVCLLFDKKDTKTIEEIKKELNDCFKKGIDDKWGGVAPKDGFWQNPFKDCDNDVDTNGDKFSEKHPEWKGCYYLRVSRGESKGKPLVVDAQAEDILDVGEVYPGCYGRAKISFWAYNNQKKGISASFSGFQKLEDGEPLGNIDRATNDDFKK